MTVDDEALRRTFEGFATGLVGDFDIADVLAELVDRVVEVVGVDGAGVSLARDDRHLGFVAATDPEVAQIEEHQEIRGGPCHEAFRHDRSVVVDDLAGEERWTGYRRAAEELDFRAVVAVPVPTNTGPVGALNLYGRDPRRWTPREVEVAELIAAMASGYLLTSVALNPERVLADQVGRAMQSRTIIEQALGIIAGHYAIDRHAAFDVLNHHAREGDATMHRVARQITEGDLELPPPDDWVGAGDEGA